MPIACTASSFFIAQPSEAEEELAADKTGDAAATLVETPTITESRRRRAYLETTVAGEHVFLPLEQLRLLSLQKEKNLFHALRCTKEVEELGTGFGESQGRVGAKVRDDLEKKLAWKSE